MANWIDLALIACGAGAGEAKARKVREKKALFDGHGSFSETPSPFQGEKSASLAFPGKGIVALPFHEPGGQFIKRFARWKLVSGPVLDGETPVCAALSLLVKFRFLAAFDGPTGNWFEFMSLAVCDVSETGSI